jgi:hypothetical protein
LIGCREGDGKPDLLRMCRPPLETILGVIPVVGAPAG